MWNLDPPALFRSSGNPSRFHEKGFVVRILRALGSTGLVAAIVTMASPAGAAIIIQAGGANVQPAENVLSTSSMTALTVFGSTNQTGRSVSFTSLNSEQLTGGIDGSGEVRNDRRVP
jgi:hypothetical protein